jgi:hypothetical protein
VLEQGWLGKKNGELLKLMTDYAFELFVTVDRNLPYQQNLNNLPVTICVLCAPNNRRDTLQLLIPKLFSRLEEGHLQKVIEIYQAHKFPNIRSFICKNLSC